MSYTEQNFTSGSKLYASQLNAMDEQIALNAEALGKDYLTTDHNTDSTAHADIREELSNLASNRYTNEEIVAINTNVSPKLAEFFTNKDFFNLNEVLKKSRKVIVCVNLFFGIVLIVFGFQIFSLFGENYTNAYYPMVILVLGQMATSFFGSNAALLNMADKQHIYKNILVAATVLNLILNLFLIPKYGMIGAASSFVASLFFWNIVAFFYVKFKILKTI